jgi:predicted hotdog family 3-hydroxylacyl-ACP dehydratase
MEPIGKEELLMLVPHRGKMLMLDRVLDYNTETAFVSTEYNVKPENIFYDAQTGDVPSWVAFELMAQSISVLSGLKRRLHGLPPNIGMILSVSNIELAKLVLKDTIKITAEQVMQADMIYTFNCVVSSSGEQIAKAKLTVMDVDNKDIENIIKHSGGEI